MVLPDIYGFSNGISLSQNTTNLRTDPKYSLSLTMSCIRRLFGNYVLVILPSISADEVTMVVVIDRICDNNLHLKFTPIIMNNLNFGMPRFSVEKTYGNYQFTANTDLAGATF